jgi:antitoxin MazE
MMQIAKWGNSLAIRLPQTVVQALKLRPGDEVEVVIAGRRRFEIARNRRREAALERLKQLKWELPPGFSFSRDEANER